VATTGGPLDLAFMVTTPTNPCPFALISPVFNKTVECGSTWSFDPPVVAYDQCCPNGPWTTNFTKVTNSPGPCGESLTGIWTVTDCIGEKAYWAETVTIQDTTPPD